MTASDGPRVWRLHLGAHKTGTTHLQLGLAARREALAAAGLRWLGPEDFAALRFHAAFDALRKSPFGRVRRRADLHAHLGALGAGAEAVALSSENLLGREFALFGPTLYPKAQPIARWLSLLRFGPPGTPRGGLLAPRARAEVKLFLAIRPLDALLPSAYAQAIKWRPVPGGFEGLRARVLARPGSWADLARRLRAGAPDAELSVWRHEDYAADPRATAALFLGLDPGEIPDDPKSRRTATPAPDAVAAAERLPEDLVGRPRWEEVMRIYRAAPAAAGDRYDPLSPEDKARLREAWEADLERLGADGALVRPG